MLMTTPMRVRAIGRGLVIASLVLLPFRLAVYLANKILILAGYVFGVLFVAGILLWFVGAVMVGYTEQPPKNPQP
jgi:cell division protein FtsW (lipid II flippase)